MQDIRDFYIRSKEHPNYNGYDIIVESTISLIVQKVEMCLFTNKGDCISDPDFGCDLPIYLWQTNLSAEYIKTVIEGQFKKYVPELYQTNVNINVFIVEGTLKDILVVQVNINEYEVNALIR